MSSSQGHHKTKPQQLTQTACVLMGKINLEPSRAHTSTRANAYCTAPCWRKWLQQNVREAEMEKTEITLDTQKNKYIWRGTCYGMMKTKTKVTARQN